MKYTKKFIVVPYSDYINNNNIPKSLETKLTDLIINKTLPTDHKVKLYNNLVSKSLQQDNNPLILDNITQQSVKSEQNNILNDIYNNELLNTDDNKIKNTTFNPSENLDQDSFYFGPPLGTRHKKLKRKLAADNLIQENDREELEEINKLKKQARDENIKQKKKTKDFNKKILNTSKIQSPKINFGKDWTIFSNKKNILKDHSFMETE